MARPITTLVVFFLCFNLFAGMLTSTGVAATIGINSDVGSNDQRENVVKTSESVSTGTSTGDTLFGMYNILSNQIGSFFNFIFPGLAMLENAGVPEYITDMLAGIFTFLIAVDVISFLRGYGL